MSDVLLLVGYVSIGLLSARFLYRMFPHRYEEERSGTIYACGMAGVFWPLAWSIVVMVYVGVLLGSAISFLITVGNETKKRQ